MSDTLLVAVEKCPLCESTRRQLTCSECVQRGSFVNSLNPDAETYFEKSSRLNQLLEERKLPLREIKSLYKKKVLGERKKIEFLSLTHRLQALKAVVESQGSENNNRKLELLQRRDAYEKSLNAVKKLKNNVFELDNEVQTHSGILNDAKAQLKETNSKLIEMRRKHVMNLKQDIFPITSRPVYKEFGTPPGLTLATRGMSNDLVVETSVSAETDLEDATKCTYEEGQWIQTSLSETEYCIAGPGLPVSGDYFKYFEWLKSYRRDPRGPEDEGSMHGIPVLEIPAALSFTCQALKIFSKILGVNLPYKVNYGDLGNPYIQQKKLFDAVTKLHKNVIHLCFSQLIHPSQLSPMQTIRNLEVCLSDQNMNLGHVGNFEVYEYGVPDSFLEQELDYLDDADLDSDDDDVSVKEEWDSLKDLQELPRDISFSDATSNPSEASLSSSATGLVTSAAASMASLWRWKKT